MLRKLTGKAVKETSHDHYIKGCTDVEMRRLRRKDETLLNMRVGHITILTRSIGRFNPGTQCIIDSIRTDECWDRAVSVTCTLKGNGEVLTLYQMKFSIRIAQAHVLASRLQLPFVIGYKMIIHKSQGLTLPKISIQFSWNSKW